MELREKRVLEENDFASSMQLTYIRLMKKNHDLKSRVCGRNWKNKRDMGRVMLKGKGVIRVGLAVVKCISTNPGIGVVELPPQPTRLASHRVFVIVHSIQFLNAWAEIYSMTALGTMIPPSHRRTADKLPECMRSLLYLISALRHPDFLVEYLVVHYRLRLSPLA